MGWSVDPSSLNQRDQRTQNVLSLFQNYLACISLTCDETGCDAWCSPACWPPPAAQISFQIRTQQHSHPEGTVSELRYKIFYRVGSRMMIFKCINCLYFSTEYKFRISSVPNKIMRWLFTALIPILRLVLTDSGLTETRYFAPSCTWPGESERENIPGFITTFQTLFSFTQCR